MYATYSTSGMSVAALSHIMREVEKLCDRVAIVGTAFIKLIPSSH
jgi:ABC-type multidrug transport system ATPase subunit